MWKSVKTYGLWSFPVILIIGIFGYWSFYPNSTIPIQFIGLLILLAVISALLITAQNVTKLKNGKKEVAAFDYGLAPDAYAVNSGRHSAMYPKILNEDIRFDKPEGLCFGKDQAGKYICIPVEELKSTCVIGGSGSGKTSSIVVPLIANNRNNPSISFLYLDPKREITDLTYHEGQDNTLIFEPGSDRQIGYDPFFMLRLDGKDSEQKVYEVMSTISVSLIAPNTKEEIWTKLARSSLTGILVYCFYYRHIYCFSEVIQYAFTPLRDIVTEILRETPINSIPYNSMVQFKDVSDEILANVQTNLMDKIRVFSTDEHLRKVLGNDYVIKWTPEILLHKNVAICMSISELTSMYGQLASLIINQTIMYIFSLKEHRQEPSRKRICIVIDEFVQVLESAGGKIQNINALLRFGRSKAASCILCAQSIAGLRLVLSDMETEDVLGNCANIAFYAAKDLCTVEYLKQYAGTFLERSESWTRGNGQRTINTSFTQSPVLLEQDIISLPSQKEMILISDSVGYCRLKRTQYFNDRHIKKLINPV